MTDFTDIINTDIINTETDRFWFNGINEKKSPCDIIILTNNMPQDSPEQIQLGKIIDACKIKAEQYYIIQVDENKPVAWHQLKTTYSPGIIILFGVHPYNLGISAMFALNQPNNFDGIICIPTLSLQELEQNPQAKKDLWLNALKPLIADKQ